jgi:hypothetical protein
MAFCAGAVASTAPTGMAVAVAEKTRRSDSKRALTEVDDIAHSDRTVDKIALAVVPTDREPLCGGRVAISGQILLAEGTGSSRIRWGQI